MLSGEYVQMRITDTLFSSLPQGHFSSLLQELAKLPIILTIHIYKFLHFPNY